MPKDIDTKKETWPWRRKRTNSTLFGSKDTAARERGWPGWSGQAVFVKGALAGEICQVQLLKVGKSAAWGLGDPGADAGSRPPELPTAPGIPGVEDVSCGT
ncbi:MAG: hypothetical protein ACLT9P_06270 [Evtepia gabavorous]